MFPPGVPRGASDQRNGPRPATTGPPTPGEPIRGGIRGPIRGRSGGAPPPPGRGVARPSRIVHGDTDPPMTCPPTKAPRSRGAFFMCAPTARRPLEGVPGGGPSPRRTGHRDRPGLVVQLGQDARRSSANVRHPATAQVRTVQPFALDGPPGTTPASHSPWWVVDAPSARAASLASSAALPTHRATASPGPASGPRPYASPHASRYARRWRTLLSVAGVIKPNVSSWTLQP
jgi:hypothetical protein